MSIHNDKGTATCLWVLGGPLIIMTLIHETYIYIYIYLFVYLWCFNLRRKYAIVRDENYTIRREIFRAVSVYPFYFSYVVI